MSAERLQKLLAAAGLGSRREIEHWIRAGRLSVDGVPAVLGTRASAMADIRLDGQPVTIAVPGVDSAQLLLYHKPAGEVTTRADPQGRPTVFERLPPPQQGRWIVVGRLDVNTTGLLLFTTDGALAHRLMHPSGGIEREYRVRVRGQPDEPTLARLRSGVQLVDGPARFERLIPEQHRPGSGTGPSDSGAHRWYRVQLREGRNREVRRLWEAVGYEVSRLMRVRYGPVALPEDLPAGQWRPAAPAALAALRRAVDSGTVSGGGR